MSDRYRIIENFVKGLAQSTAWVIIILLALWLMPSGTRQAVALAASCIASAF